MSISSVNYSTTTSTSTTTSSSSSSSLGITSSDFLQLMVEQLQNQSPLDPADTDSYLDKLVSYASYDTETAIADSLESITSTLSSTLSSSGLGYIGQTVEVTGSTTSLEDGSAEWTYTLDSNASDTTINILNEDGDVVWTGSGETDAGTYSFTWDGTTTDGTQLEDGGTYTISVEATDSDGDSVDGSTTVIGKVTGIDVSDDDSLLKIGDASFSVENVLQILAS
ncbi:flagellar hook assembly protein FlgD [Roseibium litorale]|uniref:Basal-body rod modification protein FlgD n=1 Tax=Roseibium litorale TaxID=2803841 RepID=A0ABR9CKZ0_9HYPH|nr:FlgD immunoglobulin-like domain containing protein [Roseibium litorale]MBD8891324.1 flagellar biosynthesis protein FlgD [Roseibium litorale]